MIGRLRRVRSNENGPTREGPGSAHSSCGPACMVNDGELGAEFAPGGCRSLSDRGRPTGRGIARGFMTHDDFHLLVVWCGMYGPARPFPRVGSAVASARFSRPPAVRGPVSTGTGAPGRERGHHPEDDGQDPRRPEKTLRPCADGDVDQLDCRDGGADAVSPPSARRPQDGARPTRTSTPIRRSIIRPGPGAASRAGALALDSNRWRASASMSLSHSSLQRLA